MADQNDITFKDDAVPGASFDAEGARTTGVASGTVAKLKEGASNLVSEAGSAMSSAAAEGKDKAAAALGGLTQTVENAAQLIEEKVGPQYSGYVRRAGTSVSSFAETLQNKNVDEILDDTRAFVRRSPMVAIGAAAAIGFVLTRLIKVGTDAANETGYDKTDYDKTGTRRNGRNDGTSA